MTAAVVGGAMVVGMTLPAWAVPTPSSGPTAGGTTVTDTIPAGVTLSNVSGGAAFSVAMGSDGNVYAWGNNDYGQLGDGTTSPAAAPVRMQLPAGVTVTDLVAGSANFGVRTADGSVYLTGRGDDGMLGNGDTASSALPVLLQAPDGITFSQVQLGEYSGAGLGSDGRLYPWGNGDDGQLGIGENFEDPIMFSLVPVEVPLPAGVTVADYSVGADFVIAIGSDGVTYAGGHGNYGQLGDGLTSSAFDPQVVTPPAGVRYTAVHASGMSVVATGSDGATYAWGTSMYGQAGNGSEENRVLSPVRVTQPAGVSFTSITPANYHFMAVGSDGATYAWGMDAWHQLGVGGTEMFQTVPTRVTIADLTVDSVSFGAATGTDLAVTGDEWNAITPAHACGAVDVSVVYTQLGRTSTDVTTDGFTFGSAPAVTQQPTSVALAEGESTVTLTAAASGDEAPTVQWQQRAGGGEWADIDGATSGTLTTTVAADTDFRAAFSNCLGTVESQVASVTPYVAREPVAPSDPTTPAAPAAPAAPSDGTIPTVTDPVAISGTLPAPSYTGILARTGVVVGSVAALAAALIGGGAILTALRRRRSTEH
ncbi:hypothetical protein [Cellulomonas taurus]|uniref:hypothetical protein n=1 Tax=Cellulomonas taurus TaxID=2729175 RepID=UPI00145D98F4|nr:hypothetical protein [Cellulomonas taurus]